MTLGEKHGTQKKTQDFFSNPENIKKIKDHQKKVRDAYDPNMFLVSEEIMKKPFTI